MTDKLADLSMTDEDLETMSWVQEFLVQLGDLNRNYALKWCQEVSKIGFSDVDIRETYCPVFLDKVQEQLQELNADMGAVAAKLLDRIEERLRSIETNCRMLQVEMPGYDHDDKTMYQIYEYLSKEKRFYQQQVDERRSILEAIESEQQVLCKLLGRPAKRILRDPLPKQSEVETFKNHVDHLRSLKNERESRYAEVKREITSLVEELKSTPTLDFERKIMNDSNTLSITDVDMINMEQYLKRLRHDRDTVHEQIAELQQKVDGLWHALEIDVAFRNTFARELTGNNYATLERLRAEFERCETLKRENMQLFVGKLRTQLIQVWQRCHLDVEEQKRSFFAFSHELYNEDLLELHQRELKKWQDYYEDNEFLFEMLKKHKELWEKHVKLQRTSDAANRYKNRGGRLLAEERTRNMCNKKIPELEAQLLEAAENHQVTCGRPFLIFGHTVESYLSKLHHDFDEAMKQLTSAKKLQRDKTPTGSRIVMATSKMATTPMQKGARAMASHRKPMSVSVRKRSPKSGAAAPTLKVNVVRRSLKRKRLSFKQTSASTSNKENTPKRQNLAGSTYKQFLEDAGKNAIRSTQYQM